MANDECNLNLSPRHNWVEDCGGLGDLGDVACHMMANGVPREKAIPAAINFAKHVCATDQSKNFAKHDPNEHVAGLKRARWCAAVDHWEKLRACAHARGAGHHADHLAAHGDAPTKAAIVEPLMEPIEAAGFKAVLSDEKASVTETSDGLWIEGLASEWGVDRDDEAFEPGAFDRGIKAFMANPILAYHHARKPAADGTPGEYLALGKVTDLRRDTKGLHLKAWVPKPKPGAWAEDVYDKVRQGIVRGLSVGGRFRRRMTELGPRIFDVDLQEISVTPLPVNPRTLFRVATEGKAMNGDPLEWEPDLEAYERIRDELATVVSTLTDAVTRAGL